MTMCKCKEKSYPTEWKIVNAFSPYYYDYSWEKYCVGNVSEFRNRKGNFVTIQWEREIAPFHIERKIERKMICNRF